MSKDALTPELTGKIKAFLEAKSPQEAEYQKQIDDLKKRAAAEKIPVVAAALKNAAKELEKGRPDHSILRKQEAAAIVLAVAKDLGLPIGGKKKGGKGKGAGAKKTKAQMAALTGQVLGAPELKKGTAIGVLAESLGESGVSVRNVLKKLQAAKKVVMSGTKRNAVWKLK